MNLQYMAVIKGSQIVDRTPSKIYDTDYVVLYYTKELCRPLSSACPITGRRRKGKGLEVPCKYNYYCGLTKDPAFILVIGLLACSKLRMTVWSYTVIL